MSEKRRAAQGSGSIRRRQDGRWEVRFVVGIDPLNGKTIYKSRYAATQQEARRMLAKAVREVDTHSYQDDDRITVGAWLDLWLSTYCRGILKPYTLTSYEGIIRVHLKPALATVRLCDLTTNRVQQMVQALNTAGKAPKTIKNICGCLSAALEQARVEGRLARNPCEFVRIPPAAQQEIKPLTAEQMCAFLDAAAGDTYEGAFFLCLFCGLRRGEALGLSWRQVDFDARRLLIDQQLQAAQVAEGGYYIERSTKSGKSRVLDLPPFVVEKLQEVRQAQTTAQLLAGRAWRNPWGLVFTDALGGHLHLITIEKHFKRIAATAGIPQARIHDLRHSFATLSLANGDDVKTVQANLGHATAAFTLQRYIHASEQMKRDSARRLQQFYIKSIEKKA